MRIATGAPSSAPPPTSTTAPRSTSKGCRDGGMAASRATPRVRMTSLKPPPGAGALHATAAPRIDTFTVGGSPVASVASADAAAAGPKAMAASNAAPTVQASDVK